MDAPNEVTVNLTKGTTSNTMMKISLFLGPCYVCQWSCQMELLDETTIKFTYEGGLMII